MRRVLVQMAVLALVAGACTAGENKAQQGPVANSSKTPHTPTTLTMWVAFSGRELNALIEAADTRQKPSDTYCRCIRSWIRAFHEHESRENALVGDAYNLDIGAED